MEYLIDVEAGTSLERFTRIEECDEWCRNYYREFRNGNARSGWARKLEGPTGLRYRIIGDERMAMLFKLQFCGT